MFPAINNFVTFKTQDAKIIKIGLGVALVNLHNYSPNSKLQHCQDLDKYVGWLGQANVGDLNALVPNSKMWPGSCLIASCTTRQKHATNFVTYVW